MKARVCRAEKNERPSWMIRQCTRHSERKSQVSIASQTAVAAQRAGSREFKHPGSRPRPRPIRFGLWVSWNVHDGSKFPLQLA